jgi:hypothetical protein
LTTFDIYIDIEIDIEIESDRLKAYKHLVP